MKVLVTGAAGFSGFHTAQALLARGDQVVGLDNLNACYDPGLKNARLALLKNHANFRFHGADVADREAMQSLFRTERFARVVHLGDVPDTWADVEALVHDVGYRPATALEVGVRRFVDWYLGYYKPA
jgi:nucleoside-diphosphate-sugar epimerase